MRHHRTRLRVRPEAWLLYCIFSACAVAVLAFSWFPAIRAAWRDEQEDRTYAAHPSALLALEYGDDHFDSVNHPDEYDIARAQYWLELAAMQDPHLPTVYHQLARIAFLNDDLPLALGYINLQISMEGDTVPNSYYVRGLIEGYMGDYADAVNDYAQFLKLDPDNWAGLNDYAWVLLKDDKPATAAAALAEGLKLYPDNPWLLNSDAMALYETGDTADAKIIVQRASSAVAGLTPAQWSLAYPGNNPDIAADGVATFKKAVADNMHTLFAATTSAASI